MSIVSETTPIRELLERSGSPDQIVEESPKLQRYVANGEDLELIPGSELSRYVIASALDEHSIDLFDSLKAAAQTRGRHGRHLLRHRKTDSGVSVYSDLRSARTPGIEYVTNLLTVPYGQLPTEMFVFGHSHTARSTHETNILPLTDVEIGTFSIAAVRFHQNRVHAFSSSAA